VSSFEYLNKGGDDMEAQAFGGAEVFDQSNQVVTIKKNQAKILSQTLEQTLPDWKEMIGETLNEEGQGVQTI
jgi:chemotaxis receptor (MCP) glutamine deamidase CheD